MSQLQVSANQVGTAAEIVIKALETTGQGLVVTSAVQPAQLMRAIIAASPRLTKSVPVRNSLYKLDLSTILIYWAVLATPTGSVAAFFPGRAPERGGAGTFISVIIDPMITLRASGNIVETCWQGGTSEIATKALNSATELSGSLL